MGAPWEQYSVEDSTDSSAEQTPPKPEKGPWTKYAAVETNHGPVVSKTISGPWDKYGDNAEGKTPSKASPRDSSASQESATAPTSWDFVKAAAHVVADEPSRIYHAFTDPATDEENKEYAEEKKNNIVARIPGLQNVNQGIRRTLGRSQDADDRFERGVKSGFKGIADTGLDAAKSVGSYAFSQKPLLLSDEHGDALIPELTRKFITDPAEVEYNKALRAPTGIEALGHSVASAMPLIGPIAGHLAEKAGEGDVAGAVGEGATYVLAPEVSKVAPEAVGSLTKGVLKRIPIIKDVPEMLSNAADRREAAAQRAVTDDLIKQAEDKAPLFNVPGLKSKTYRVPDIEGAVEKAEKIKDNPVAYPLGMTVGKIIGESPWGRMLKAPKPTEIPYETAEDSAKSTPENAESEPSPLETRTIKQQIEAGVPLSKLQNHTGPLGRIETVIPEAGNIISNVEDEAKKFGAQLPAESASKPGLKPIDLSGDKTRSESSGTIPEAAGSGPYDNVDLIRGKLTASEPNPYDNVDLIRNKLTASEQSPYDNVDLIRGKLGKTQVRGDVGLKPIDLSRLEPLLSQATGGKALEPNITLREQGFGKIQSAGEEPQKLSSDPRKAVLQKAGATPEEITTILQRGTRFDPTSKVGLSKLAEHFGVDLGESAIGRGKADMAAGTHLPPREVLQRIIDAGHSPKEIAKAIDEGKHLPTVGGGSQSSDHAPTFYSKAERIAKEKVSTGSGDSMLAALRNNGVKESEIQWMGLDDYLKDKPRVSKADLQQFIANNKIELKEVNLGGESHEQLKQLQGARNSVYAENNRIWTDHLRNAPHSAELFNAMQGGDPESVIAQMPKGLQEPARNFVLTDNLLRNYDKAIDKMSKRGADKTPHYSAYTLPGEKSNYAEKLLALPEENDLPRLREEYDAANTGRTKYLQTLRPVPGDVELRFHDAQEAVRKAENSSQPFRTAHYPDEPNVLAHVRYDDRTSTDGKKVLMLEEAQSDWHQKGKQIGYQNPAPTKLPDGVYIVPNNGFFQVVNREGNPLLSRTWASEADAQKAALEHYGEGAGNPGVPNAPFKDTWHELVLKRMLRHAAENGYDRLAWTTGDQQAARYDLSKQLDHIEVVPRTDPGTLKKTRSVYLHLHNSGSPIQLGINSEGYVDNSSEDGFAGKRLSDVVGKSVTDKIMQNTRQTINGVDLKIGGEWAKALYDRAIPRFLNSYLKKWGGKVGETQIPSQPNVGRTVYMTHESDGLWIEGGGHREGPFPRTQEDEVLSKIDAINRASERVKVHSVEINDKMRKSLLHDGQPISQNEPDKLTPEKKSGFGRIDLAA